MLTNVLSAAGAYRAILTALPPHTLSDECLVHILEKNRVPASVREKVQSVIARNRAFVASLLQNGVYEEEFPVLSPAAFAAEPPSLVLSGLFCETELHYEEADYREHLRLTRTFAKNNPRYTARETAHCAFRNLQIFIHKGKWVGVSKCKTPAIHFVIRHPRLPSCLIWLDGNSPLVIRLLRYGIRAVFPDAWDKKFPCICMRG